MRLYDDVNGRAILRRDGFVVRGLFSDLRHHDMGPDFEEIDFGGNKNRIWRTPPLWGVGSGFPWAHDGQSLTLEHVIERHGGEAARSRQQWRRAPAFVRAAVLDFLGKLQLYDIETLPTDVDGDGRIARNFRVAGMNTGIERFNPEWLFVTPVQIQGRFRNTDGAFVNSFAATNLAQSYGLTLPLRQDADNDGWPDVWDRAPNTVGYRDGVR